jgi:hypothetical protein
MQRHELETAGMTYAYLRGLIAVPGGALFILAACANAGIGPLGGWGFLVAALLVALAAFAVTRYYNANYGRLTLTTRQEAVFAALMGAVAVFMLVTSLLLRSRAGWSLDLPVNAIPVSFALAMLAVYRVGTGLKPHHILVWGSLLVAGALPVWDGADPSNTGLVLAGVAVMVNGVFDHRLFVHTFGPRRVAEVDG